ncbi:MAG: FAD-dependent oxidoreductase, partial [Alistipes sp.]|nr:FAD-dependent oxidoreductase [Alistipes sp.]
MYDIIIIGSGPGGYVAAIRASQLGKKVALVEKAELGGVCLNWGCIPTKALLKSAQVYTYCKNAAHYGVEITGEVKPDFEKIVARSRTVAETMSKGVAFLMKKNNIEIIPGFGKIAGKGKVDVDGVVYEAQNIILATGARPRQMPFMPIDGEHVISSKEALTLTKLPESMIVVGSGAIGSELASLYASLGVKVTVVEYMPQFMPLLDAEVSAAAERAFRRQRITV